MLLLTLFLVFLGTGGLLVGVFVFLTRRRLAAEESARAQLMGRSPTGLVIGDRPASILRDDSGIKAVEAFDHTVTAEFHGEDEDLARLLGRLISSGVVVSSFAEENLSLEEVFMMITKGIVN